MYCGRKGDYGSNYQGTSTPDGLLVHLFGPTVTLTNDYLLYKESHIADILREVAQGPNNLKYKIYGDKGYANLADNIVEAQLKKPRRGNLKQQFLLNRTMTVE